MIKAYIGNAKEVLKYMEPDSVDACFTSPPYWNMRNYGVEGELF